MDRGLYGRLHGRHSTGQRDRSLPGIHYCMEIYLIRHTTQAVHSSPLQRCHRLAAHLFPSHSIVLHDELMEIHCGQWEMRKWDELPEEETGPLMKDFVNTRFPGGENYQELHE